MLHGKQAIITGSTSGIGLGIAKRLARAGVNIVINGFGDSNEINTIVSELKQLHHVDVHYDPADMRDAAQIERMVKETITRSGRVDILVNNAGVQHVSPIEDFPINKWDDIIAINLSSVFHTIRAAVPSMKKHRFGRIINIASVHGLIASPFKSAYIAAKHGVVGLTKTIALELGSDGVTVNAICPGYVNTPLVQKQIPDQARTHGISEEEVVKTILLKNHAIKSFVEVEELAELVLFLCTDAAKTMTGISIPVDCGWTSQ